MPLEIGWYIPLQVADARFWGTVTIDDMQHYSDCCVQMLTEVQTHAPDRRAYMIMDTREVDTMPPVYRMMKQALPVLRFKNRDTMFHITKSTAIRSIIELSAHVTQFKLRSFATREEALLALEAMVANEGFRQLG